MDRPYEALLRAVQVDRSQSQPLGLSMERKDSDSSTLRTNIEMNMQYAACL